MTPPGSRAFFAVASCLAFTSFASLASAQDLAPPPPMNPNAPGAPGGPTAPGPLEGQSTTSKLDEAEREDSGRNFELFWVNADLGASYINMRQLSEDNLQIDKASSGGPMFGLGAGVRFVIFTVGARARYNVLSPFNLWQLNLEAGLKFPIKSFDIGFGVHGGYSFAGRIGDASVTQGASVPAEGDKVSVRGFNTGLDFVFDYYLTPIFSIGAAATADVLFLNRPAVDKPGGLTPAQQAAVDNDPLYQRSGTSAGLQLGGGLRVGVHFGL